VEKLGRKEVINRLHDIYCDADDKKKRIRILEILNQLRDKSHFKQIENYFLSDEDPNVRIEAAKLLAFNHEQKKAIKPLIWVFEHEKDEFVRLTALRLMVALGHVRSEFLNMVVESLKKTLKSEDYKLKMEAVESLGILKEKSAVNDLIMELKSKNKQVQLRVMQALETLGDERAVPHLLKALGTASIDLWTYTFNALKKIRGPSLFEDLISNLGGKADSIKEGYIRKGTAKALGFLGDKRAIRHLITLLDDQFYWVRWEAIEALDNLDYDWRKRYKYLLGNKILTIKR